ncbi:acyl-CoA N-acyltransferase [Venturia nashicola]|nr:acyl-CoA N-acyltransferase [Venturia nashicola]
MSQTPTIRLATREEILAMIHELAAFEKASDSVLATEASLSLTLSFAPSPPDASLQASAHGQPTQAAGYAKTFIITAPEGGIAGMALFFHSYSTWRAAPGIYLEDLFIRPAFRRRRYATLLLKELANEVLRIGGARLEWACLDWNTNALTFYRSLGARTKDEWVGLRVDGDALKKLAEKSVDVKKV